jgi:hypothetical protein
VLIEVLVRSVEESGRPACLADSLIKHVIQRCNHKKDKRKSGLYIYCDAVNKRHFEIDVEEQLITKGRGWTF